MKKILFCLLFCLPSFCFATWQIAGSPQSTAQGRFKQANDIPATLRINPRYTLHVNKGSVKSQLENYLEKHHWHLLWQAKTNDFFVHSAAIFTGQSVISVITGFLKNYPHLKASFDTTHLTLTITSTPNPS